MRRRPYARCCGRGWRAVLSPALNQTKATVLLGDSYESEK
jgi:hypothetical protein